MQTFLPYPDFRESAAVLDYRRLGKQRLEAFQLLNVLNGERGGWRNHPAAKMWRGYPDALGLYMNAVIEEWVRRGYRNSMGLYEVHEPVGLPPWLGDPAFHASHRSNLLRKDPDFYAQFGWSEPPTLPYVWPTVAPHDDGPVTTGSADPSTG
jgi:hypothetical protein